MNVKMNTALRDAGVDHGYRNHRHKDNNGKCYAEEAVFVFHCMFLRIYLVNICQQQIDQETDRGYHSYTGPQLGLASEFICLPLQIEMGADPTRYFSPGDGQVSQGRCQDQP